MTAAEPVYDELATPAQMTADCRAAEARLSFPHDRSGLAASLMASAAERSAPSLRFEDLPREVPKPQVHPAVAAQRIAAALALDLD